MKKLIKMTLGTACMAGLLALPFQASSITFTVGDANYVGAIINGVPPGNDNEFTWLNELINVGAGLSLPSANPAGESLDRTASTLGGVLPAALAGDKSDPPQQTYVIGADSLYLMGKYGQAFPGGQALHVWYLGNLAVGTEVTLPGPVTQAGGPLSHDTLFTGTRGDIPGTPDGGTTLLLLGAAMAGFAALRRKLA